MELSQVVSWIFLVNAFTTVYGNGGRGSFLNLRFDKVLTGGRNLRVYRSDRSAVRSGSVQCANLCKEDKEVRDLCQAFRYDPVEHTCHLYSTASKKLSYPGVEIFLITIEENNFHVISVAGRRYAAYLSSYGKTFSRARVFCQGLGGYLLEFDSLEEYEAVKLASNSRFDFAFVGANDLDHEGEWVTDRDGQPIRSDLWVWKDGQPDNYGSSHHCATIHATDYQLYDFNCDFAMKFFCEKDIS